ncbi:MAG: PLP-dependent cysteine synthase family protein [Anaerolineae bacterium]
MMLHTMPQMALAPALVPAGTAVEQLVGNTPLIPLRGADFGISPAVRILAKAEWFNPGGSIKDRAALNIIRTAEEEGRLTPARTLIDATSGNTGIGYAMLCAARGYRLKLIMPENVSQERINILRIYGAELIFSDPLEGMDGAIEAVRQMVAADPEAYFYADQYSNPANWRAHYQTTGPEIWRQTEGRVTHFVAGLGTSGTMMGVGRYLRSVEPGVRLVSLQPDGPLHGIEGLKHMQSALVPPIYDPALVDENREVPTDDAYHQARRLAREEGLFVGVSAAAAVAAAMAVARELTSGTVVTVLPDGGYKYLSERFWRGNGA